MWPVWATAGTDGHKGPGAGEELPEHEAGQVGRDRCCKALYIRVRNLNLIL